MKVPLLEERARAARDMLASCALCPRACGANRLAGGRGFCRAGAAVRVAAVSLHFGEEPPISGTRGSGTVFTSRCNLRCLFCQNYPISQLDAGRDMTPEELGERLLWLADKGAHNVNFVTPTPHVPQIIEALLFARTRGLAIPVVYNTNGYDSLETLALLDGIVDIYLPDRKYRTQALAREASDAPDYPLHNARAVAEMVRQVGPLETDEDGIARRGVLIRHLVLPGRVGETAAVLAHIRREFGADMPVSLMGQYFPAYEAPARPGYDRKLTAREYDRAIAAAVDLGLTNVAIQEI
ncbi:MAG: radical SAM protein [Deltaproteobacteria bacterium]|nr:radical SAM protein [Deltaproteobacteria bacterium]